VATAVSVGVGEMDGSMARASERQPSRWWQRQLGVAYIADVTRWTSASMYRSFNGLQISSQYHGVDGLPQPPHQPSSDHNER